MTTTTTRNRTKTARVHGWEGSGLTVAEAKADAVRKIEAAAEGYYTPKVITFRGIIAVITREPEEGWSYFLVYPDGRPMGAEAQEGKRHEMHSRSSCSTLGETERRARHHMAQNGFAVGECPETAAAIVDPSERLEFWSWAIWQNAYRAHKAADPEAADHECREYAARVQNAWRYAD